MLGVLRAEDRGPGLQQPVERVRRDLLLVRADDVHPDRVEVVDGGAQADLLRDLHRARLELVRDRLEGAVVVEDLVVVCLFPIRRQFQQYVNLRPVRLLPGIPCPLRDKQPGDIDFWIVRENSEGEYSQLGGRMNAGTDDELVIQEAVFTRRGTDRIMTYAFELARKLGRKHVTSATKSNGIYHSMPFWDERFAAVGARYPEIRTDQYHIDILAARFVMSPERFDVVVGSNLFGDILSDLGPGVTGTIAVAPSANLNPERTFPSMFEPVHGSAPDIAGKGIANPIGQIWAGAMLLDHLGEHAAAAAVTAAIENVLRAPSKPLTPDLGGRSTTVELGQAIAAAVTTAARDGCA